MSTADTGNSKPMPVDAKERAARMPPYFAGAEGFAVVAVFTSRNHL